MVVGVQYHRFSHVQIGRLFLITGTTVLVLVTCQLFWFSNQNGTSVLTSPSNSSIVPSIESVILLKNSKLGNVKVDHRVRSNSTAYNPNDVDEADVGGIENDEDDESVIDEDGEVQNEITFQSISEEGKSLSMEKVIQRVKGPNQGVDTVKSYTLEMPQKTNGEIHKQSSVESLRFVSPIMPLSERVSLNPDSRNPLSTIAGKQSFPANKSLMTGYSILKRKGAKPMSIAHMNLLFLRSSESNKFKKTELSSPRDRELLSARFQIEHAPIIKKTHQLDASLFRNLSMFKRSYELMERILKVYIYNEGEKPIFHQPYLKGIYASEGWFLKLMEGNKQFVTRDPRKAHLFYIPVSLLQLRSALHQEGFARWKDLGNHLKKYIETIAKKFHFWNRVRGADHFLVGCHDWAPRITRNNTGNSIRVLCNSNVASGFTIGKDVSLPVTYIRSGQNPQKGIGGNTSSERPILAFFAGGMHGYLRPILLKYWENKEPDMKIFGPMPRDIEGKAKYREYMKSSKYCICARGFEVHTPRVVESIYYECVPVIISDNYVPPFFEVLDWEAFSVFVSENDIPNLRNILLSIPEEKYVAMQQRVKMVQRHFLWNKKPVKYDLFHMILHSVWYNRVFQIGKDRENL